MADRTVRVRLEAMVGGFVAQFAGATGAVSKLNKEMAGTAAKRDALDGVARGAGLLGVALVGAAAAAVGVAANFDKAMSGVAATGDDARSHIDALRKAAIQAGADTAYSASEAANGIEQLAKAGVSSADILGGGLKGALDLAAAGGIDVAAASEDAASAMTQFALKGKDVPHIADLLAAAAGKAQGGVSEMATALNYAGLPAHALGVSIEQTTGTLAEFASAGLIGDQAGTTLRGMLSSLTSPSQKAADTMKDLGIQVFDSSGKFIGLDGTAQVLHDRLKGLTQQQRTAALGTIFSNAQLQGANILYQGGAAAVHKWTKAVNDSGYAQKTAATRLDNLAGDFEKLKGSAETALIGIGEGGMGPLRTLVQAAEHAVNAFNDLPGPIKQAGLLLTGGAGLGLLAAAAMIKVVSGVNSAVAAFKDLRGATSAIGGVLKSAGFGPWGVVVGVAAAGLGAFWQAAQKTKENVDNLTQAIVADGNAIGDTTAKQIAYRLETEGLLKDAAAFGISAGTLTSAVLGQASAIDAVRSKLRPYTAATRGAASATIYGAAASGEMQTKADHLGGALRGMTGDVHEASNAAHRQTQATKAASKAMGVQAAAQTRGLDPIQAVNRALKDQADAFDKDTDAAFKAAHQFLDVRSAQRDLREATAEANKWTRTHSHSMDISTKAGRDNAAELDKIAGKHVAVLEAIKRDNPQQDVFRRKVIAGREQLFKQAQQFGLTRDQAKTYIDKVLKIPDKATTRAQFEDQQARRRLDAFRAKAIATLTLPKFDANVDVHLSKAARAFTAYGQSNRSGASFSGAAPRTPPVYARALGGRADPGPIRGGGTPTSDSVPLWTSRDEHIVAAREVAGLGGGSMSVGHRMLAEQRAMWRGAGRRASGGQAWDFGRTATVAPRVHASPMLDVAQELARLNKGIHAVVNDSRAALAANVRAANAAAAAAAVASAGGSGSGAMTMGQVKGLMESVGANNLVASTFAAIATREAGRNPNRNNFNAKTQDHSYGLFQINTIGGNAAYIRSIGHLRNVNQLNGDPLVQARVAMAMYRDQGFRPWLGYRAGIGTSTIPLREALRTPADPNWRAYLTSGGGVGGGGAVTTGPGGALPGAAAALARAQRQITSPSQNWYDLCAKFVSDMWGTPKRGFGTAASWWQGIPRYLKHPGQAPGPAGAELFWGGGGGHVDLYAGGGRSISTDARRQGRVDYAPWNFPSKVWGKPYLGWAKPWFDGGGVAYGAGAMYKKTLRPERVLSPKQTADFSRLVNVLDRGDRGATINNTQQLPGKMVVRIGDRDFEAYIEHIGDRQDKARQRRGNLMMRTG